MLKQNFNVFIFCAKYIHNESAIKVLHQIKLNNSNNGKNVEFLVDFCGVWSSLQILAHSVVLTDNV